MAAAITGGGHTTETREAPGSDAEAQDHEPQQTEPVLAWHNQQLSLAQAELLLDSNRLAALLNFLTAPFLTYLLYGSVPHQHLLLWTSVIMSVSVIRFLMISHYRHSRPSRPILKGLKRSVLFWNAVSGLAWGSTAFLVYPPNALPQLILLLLVLAVVSSIAVTIHSGMLTAILAFVIPTILPMIARLSSEHTPIHDQLALLATVYLLVTILIAFKMNRLTLRGIRVAVDNDNLLNHLKQAREESDKLNTELRREITERRDTEVRLRQERDFISGILDTENAIVVVMDLDGVILRFNRACEAATGYYVHEVIGKPLWEALLPDDEIARFKRYFTAVVDGYFPVECEIRWRSKANGDRIVQLSNTAILGMDGKCTHVVSTGVDITDRCKAEAALARTQENFEFLVEGVTDYAIYMLDQDGTIVSWNLGAERISGYKTDEVIGMHFNELFSPIDLEQRQAPFELRIAAVDGHYRREGWYTKRDGNRFWATFTINPVRGSGGELRGFSVIINDITVRKQAEMDLAQSREQLRSLSGHLQNVREEEKASLARELHDELGSMLTTLKIEVSSLQKQLMQAPPETHDNIDAIVGTVHDAIATTRRISTSLRPPILDSLGLLPAVEWQLEQFRRLTGKAVDLHVAGDSVLLGKDHTIAIFRILQEGLTNIARHAEASRVSVAVAIYEKIIAMDIIDDGVGFTVGENKTRESYGLYSMQERARALGGSVDIISQPDEGTRLKVRVPITPLDERLHGVKQ